MSNFVSYLFLHKIVVMNVEEIRKYCLSKNGTSEDMPFDECVLAFRVANKIFALMNICKVEGINLKYPSDEIEELRANHAFILPGYHMSKQHWNTVSINDTSTELLKELIDISYGLIFDKLSKKQRDSLLNGK